MSIDAAITVLTSLVAVGVLILLAGIPWAYGVHGRLTKIETSLKNHLRGSVGMADLERRVTRLELTRSTESG